MLPGFVDHRLTKAYALLAEAFTLMTQVQLEHASAPPTPEEATPEAQARLRDMVERAAGRPSTPPQKQKRPRLARRLGPADRTRYFPKSSGAQVLEGPCLLDDVEDEQTDTSAAGKAR